jgi:hypothetical protein
MYLVEDKRAPVARARNGAAPLPSDPWEHFPFSSLSHHGEACCEIARQWVIANDFAQLNGSDRLSGPRWLRQRYNWGPSVWPLHWCNAVSAKVIDCGAHAALAHEAFVARGLTAWRAQFVQRYDADATDQWRYRWGEGQASDHWLSDGFIYHEGNALLVGSDELKLWDGSAGFWLNPRQHGGYGSVVAVRIFADAAASAVFRWGDRRIVADGWNQLADVAPSKSETQVSAFFRK